MNLKIIVLSLSLSLAFFGCDIPTTNKQEDNSTEVDSVKAIHQNLSEGEQFVYSIEQAHQKAEVFSKEVIQFDLNLMFGGNSRFSGTISMTPDGSLIKMEDSNKTVIWDGEEVLVSPDTASIKGTRFDVLTWSYFFAAAYKLSDPGAKMEILGERNLTITASETADSSGVNYNAGKLTFKNGVGDSPDDWYIVYQDKETDLMAAMAYIVTYGGKDQEKAEKNPHAITYEAYAEIEGIPFATQWNFWTWNQVGELDKLLGEASLSNIRFVKKSADFFKPASNSKSVEKPEA